MAKKAIPVIAIVGRSKVGKTILIEKLIPLFARKGFKVATIKHHPHDFDIDYPGKDSFRHRQAGAKLTMIASPRKIAFIENLEEEIGIEEICNRYLYNIDIVIAEGFKTASIPKIEVFQKRAGNFPVCRNDKQLIAIVTDDVIDMPVPLFKTHDIDGIARFIVEKFFGKKSC
jgi:molybdopterin-guanine dinucleotide biosynthesis protein MobB